MTRFMSTQAHSEPSRVFRRLLPLLALASFQLLTGSFVWAQDAATGSATKPSLDIYGFAMVDTGYDFKSNNPDWFDVMRPTKLPSFDGEFGRNGNFYAGVRQSRFGVKGYMPTPWAS